jgi:hypothetical protein
MDPITLGLVGVGMGAAGMGMGAMGQAAAGQAASAQAKGQQAMANYNAAVAQQQARATEQATLYKQQKAADAAARQQGAMRASLGASGAVPTEGTPLLLQSKQAAESQLDNLMIGYQGQVAAAQQRSQAGLDTMQAGIYGQQASAASQAGMIGAGSTLLTGFGNSLFKYGWGSSMSGSGDSSGGLTAGQKAKFNPYSGW